MEKIRISLPIITILSLMIILSYNQQCLYTDSSKSQLANSEHQFRLSSNCYPCLSQCQSCTSLIDKTCNKGNCESTFFYNTQNNTNKCQKCSSLCQTCQTTYNNCLKCISGYYLIQSTMQCRQCPIGALQCTGGIAVNCKDGYFYDSNQFRCKKCMNGCVSCQQSNICSQCDNGYLLQNNGICSFCSIANCKLCYTSNTCSQCSQSYKLVTSTQNSSTTYKCQKYLCTDINCLQCLTSATQCNLCSKGYYLSSIDKKCYYGSSILCDRAQSPMYSRCSVCSFLAYRPDKTTSYCIPKVQTSNLYQTKMLSDHSFQICTNPYLVISNFNKNLKYTMDKILPSYKIIIRGVFLVRNTKLDFIPNFQIKITFNQNTQLISTLINSIKPSYYCNSSSNNYTTITKIENSYSFQSKLSVLNLSLTPMNPTNLTMPLDNIQISLKQLLFQFYLCLVPNCQVCISGNLCTVCKQPFYAQQYSCVTQCSSGLLANDILRTCTIDCQLGFYPDLINFKCSSCPLSCKTCDSSTSCISCASGYYLQNFICVINCSNTMVYPNYNTNVCQSCENLCQTCSIKGNNCTSCRFGYLFNNSCTEICPSGYFSVFNNKIASCLQCSSSSNCKQCYIKQTFCSSCVKNSKFFLTNNGQCLQTCPNGYYKNLNSQKCEKCTQSCQWCQSISNNCTKCKIGILINSSKQINTTTYINSCIPKCPQGYYHFQNNSHNQCLKCLPPCIICESQTKCLKCNNTFTHPVYLQTLSYQCLQKCTSTSKYMNNSTNTCQMCIYPCKTCQQDYTGTKCLTCQKDFSYYNVNSSKNCLLICPDGYFSQTNLTLNMQVCSICASNCSICDSLTSCRLCQNNLKLNNGICVNGCPINQFYNKNTLQCQLCDLKCLTCDNSSTTCLSCYPNNYLFKLENRCVVSCPKQYFIDTASSSCKICQSPCLQCVNNSTSCLSCTNSTFFLELNGTKKCLAQCPDNFFNNNITKKCQVCPITCLKCTSLSICTLCVDTAYKYLQVCIQTCPIGYFQNKISVKNSITNLTTTENVCSQCDSKCEKCQNLTYCYSCNPASYLYKVNNTCVSQCPNNLYQSQSTRQCLNCLPPCKTCQNLMICTSCFTGDILFKEQCIKECPQQYFLQTVNNISSCSSCNNGSNNCLTCLNNSYCLSCVQGYFFEQLSHKCVLSCPSKFYQNLQSNQCSPCQPPCNDCLDSQRCVNCVPNYLLQNNLCITICPIGTYLQSTNLTCQQCDSKCLQCNSLIKCLTCASNYYLFNYTCYSQCPSHTFLNFRGQQCEKCSLNCENCLGIQSNCTSCTAPKLFQANKCVNSCSQFYYLKTAQNGNNICQRCSQWCLQCIDSFHCLKCSSSYLHNNGCVLQCPIGTYGDIYQRKCFNCGKGCLQCKNSQTCLRCDLSMNFSLFAIQCISFPCSTQLYYFVDNNQCVQPLSCENRIINKNILTNHKDKECYLNISKPEQTNCPINLIRRGYQCLYKCNSGQFINQQVVCENGYSDNDMQMQIGINRNGIQLLLLFRNNIIGERDKFQTNNIPNKDDFIIELLIGASKTQLIKIIQQQTQRNNNDNNTNRLLQSLAISQTQQQYKAYVLNNFQIQQYRNNFIKILINHLPVSQRFTPLNIRLSLTNPYRKYLYQSQNSKIPLQNYQFQSSLSSYTQYSMNMQPLVIVPVILIIFTIIVSILVLYIHWKPHLLYSLFQFQQYFYLLCFLQLQIMPSFEPFLKTYQVLNIKWFDIIIKQSQIILSPPQFYAYTYDINLISNTISNIIIGIILLLILGLIYLMTFYPNWKYHQLFQNISKTKTKSILKSFLWLCSFNILLFAYINVFYHHQIYQTQFTFWSFLSYIILVSSFAILPIMFYIQTYHKTYLDEGLNLSKRKMILAFPLYKVIRRVMIVFFLAYYWWNPIYVLCLTLLLTSVIFLVVFWYQPYQVQLRNKLGLVQQALFFTFNAFLILYVLNQQIGYGLGVFLHILAVSLVISCMAYPIYICYNYFRKNIYIQPIIKQQQQTHKTQEKDSSSKNLRHDNAFQYHDIPRYSVLYDKMISQYVGQNQNSDNIQADISSQDQGKINRAVVLQGMLRLAKKQPRKIQQFKNYMIDQKQEVEEPQVNQ